MFRAALSVTANGSSNSKVAPKLILTRRTFLKVIKRKELELHVSARAYFLIWMLDTWVFNAILFR